nr:NAD-dependent succinate-semialdehyde dehydrogenase [Paraburkholderia ferrariae]
MSLKHPALWRSACYANGKWVEPGTGSRVPVTNPANGKVIGTVGYLEREDLSRIVDAAYSAFAGWRWVPVNERSRLLRRWAELILQHRDDLAAIMSLEQGKPLAESLDEIDYGASFVSWFAEDAKRLNGRTIPSHLPDSHLSTMIEPAGVAVLFTPWNAPSAMIARKVAPALAAGCTAVVKPAQETPFSAFALAYLAELAGIPDGVFNVVLGEPDLAMRTLVSHPNVRSVSFTGSTRVGKLVLQACAAAGIRKIALELGGNAPMIVMADADLELATDIALSVKFAVSGQNCIAANRIFVERPVYHAFLALYTTKAASLVVGPGLDPATNLGPLTRTANLRDSLERIDDAVGKGARIMLGGTRHPLGGNFLAPTILADVTPDMRVCCEENFAPVSGVAAFDTLPEVICLSNATEYGLAAYVCASSVATIMHLVHRLEFGMVAVNSATFTGAPIPFGGGKASGLGREGGMEGFEPFVETKYVCFGNLGLPRTEVPEALASGRMDSA